MKTKQDSYDENFKILEGVAESLNRDEISIDDLVVKTKEALEAARNCIRILNFQKGEFRKLEIEFESLLKESGQKETEGDPEGSGESGVS